MSEFRVQNVSADGRNRGTRLILWGVILTLAAIAVFSIFGHPGNAGLNAILTAVVIVIVVASALGANVLAVQSGLEKIERDSVFVLNDEGLIRQRKGWPDVRIGLSEIKALREMRDGLLIESVEPRRQIVVPKEVQGFALLRTELEKHSPVIESPRHLPHKTLPRVMPMIASLLCWGLVLWSRDANVVKVMASTAVALMGFETFQINKQLRDSPKRFVVLSVIVLSWIAALLLIYLRIVR